MSSADLTLFGALMLLGIVGVVIPFIPGLLLIDATALLWAVERGEGTGRWLVVAAVTLVVIAGTIAKYVVPSRRLSGAGAPWTTTAIGVVGAIVGFFAIPIVGVAVGFIAGIMVAELLRHRALGPAWTATVLALKAVGISMLVELFAATTAVAVWLFGALVL